MANARLLPARRPKMSHDAARLALAAGQSLELEAFVIGKLFASGCDQKHTPAYQLSHRKRRFVPSLFDTAPSPRSPVRASRSLHYQRPNLCRCYL